MPLRHFRAADYYAAMMKRIVFSSSLLPDISTFVATMLFR